MVTYGDWIQDPDYSKTRPADTTPIAHEMRAGYAHYDTGQIEGSTWPQVFELIPPMVTAANQALAPGEVAIADSGLRIEVDNSANVSPPWVRKEVHVRTDFYAHVLAADASYSPAEVPPDAIGIEWGNGSTEWWAEPEVLTAELTVDTGLLADLGDNTRANGQADPFTTQLLRGLDVEWTGSSRTNTGVVAWDPDYSAHVESIDGSGGGPGVVRGNLAAPIDVTAHLDEYGRILLFTTTDAMFGGAEQDGTINDMVLSTGWILEEVVSRWTYRPPAYRFLYEDSPVYVPPIRRTFPRPDGRAGGAPRTFPPSPTIQSGNRTSGAIF